MSQTIQSPSAVSHQRRWLPLMFLIISVQILVPTGALLGEPPSRFGWQMYSGLGEIPQIVVIDEAGTTMELPFGDVSGAPRAEIDWDRYIPDHVCRDFDNARYVKISYSSQEAKHQC